jgi:hypothetical protein
VSRPDWPELRAEALRLLRVGDQRSTIERIHDNVERLGAQFAGYRQTEAVFGEDAARFEQELDAREGQRDLALLAYLAQPIRVLLDGLDEAQQDDVAEILRGPAPTVD